MIKIILADDHQMIREGMSALLKDVDNVEIVATASNGKEVLEYLESKTADMVLMDINMPILDGLQTTKEISGEYPEVKVLILSMHNKQGYIKDAIEVGASGYILKNTGRKELLLAIEHIKNGGTYFSQDVTHTLVNNMREGSSEGITLTIKEKEVLELLSNGLTTAVIAKRIMASDHTVDTYRRNLLMKFKAKNVSELIKISIRDGFIS